MPGLLPPKVSTVHNAEVKRPAGTLPTAAAGLRPVPMLLAISVVAELVVVATPPTVMVVVLAQTGLERFAKMVLVPSVKVLTKPLISTNNTGFLVLLPKVAWMRARPSEPMDVTPEPVL